MNRRNVTAAATLGTVLALLGVCLAACSASSASSNRGQETTGSSAPGSARIDLPAARPAGPISLEQAIRERRSVRAFTTDPLTIADVGQLLWSAQGMTSSTGRAAPSAGATYPLTACCVAGSVSGLPPGVYRYEPGSHSLLLVVLGDVRAALARAALDQRWVAEAPVCIVLSAEYARTTSVYGERGVRYVDMEAGHAAENIHLQAVALGLGSVPVGAFWDEEVSRVLGLPEEESPLYIIPVGRARVR